MDDAKKGLFKKIINILLDILIAIFGLILAISIYNNIQIQVLGNKYSSFFGYSTFEVKTGSMGDAIHIGDWIIVKKTPTIKLNDIVTYQKNNEFITHRVIEVYKNSYVTKGDANTGKDDTINKDQIVGVVVKVLPGFGIIRRTLFNPLVLITLIITLVIFDYVLKNNKKTGQPKKILKFKKKAPIVKKVVLEEVEKEEVIEKEPVEEVVEKIEEKVEDEVVEEETTKDLTEELDPLINPADINKTMAFRMVDVDKNELENSLLKVSKSDLDDLEEENAPKEEDIQETNEEIKEKIKIITSKRKKFKNIIDKVMFVKNEEIDEIVDIINNKEKEKKNEATIRDELKKCYIDGKYYNYVGNINVEYTAKNMISRIDNELERIGEELVKKYKGTDDKYSEKVNKYVEIFTIINDLEESYIKNEDVNSKREAYNKLLSKYYKEFITDLDLKNNINSIIKTQKLYRAVIRHIFNEQDTTTFEMEYSKINNKKNLLAVDLKHNIAFSKVYSDYIVDKTYTEGVIAEDKCMILLNLLLVRVLNDMFDREFTNKYFIYVPGSVYTKSNKQDKIFGMFDDEYAREAIEVVVLYEDLAANKKLFKDLKKIGYHFSVVFSEGSVIKEKDQKIISICDYVLMSKEVGKNSDLVKNIPNDVTSNIIYDDIMSKVNGTGGK